MQTFGRSPSQTRSCRKSSSRRGKTEERERDLNEVSRQARSRRSYIQKWHALDDPDAELKQIREERQLLEESWATGLE